MAQHFDDSFPSDNPLHDIDRRLDRDFEREGGYRSPRRIPLNPRGTLRAAFDADLLNPPTLGVRR